MALQSHLGLAENPRRIEGFDVSTFHGSETVASLVVWEAGRMRKGEYRSFNIRGLDGSNDFAALHQAVRRRYDRMLNELGTMPDLILIDGGRGQLNAALESLIALGVEETPIVALAKRDEELYLADRPEPLRLDPADPGLQVLQQVRDEAHRFALTRHRRRRKRRTLVSELDSIPGIGARRKKVLLQHFGSVEKLREASVEEVTSVLGTVLGSRVFNALHEE